MADQTTSLEAELERRQQEIERLRALLIERDRELGSVRGQLMVVESTSRRLTTVALRIQHRLPGLVRLAGAVRRRISGSNRG